jgi:hypothetical protein
VIYAYDVRAVHGPHEVGEVIASGSQEDVARTTFAINNTAQVKGRFDPSDDHVDFNDFFLFADHFGTIDGQGAYDLSPNNAIDFDDFFVFADNFGRTRTESTIGD